MESYFARRRREWGPRNGRQEKEMSDKMGMQFCCQGHEIKLPWYGPQPTCNDCKDLIIDYAGQNSEDDESEDDIVEDPGGDEEDS